MNFASWLVRPRAVQILAIAALLYAFCAGFRTIGDFDFGWQIATGRYVAQHHQIPRTDVFTYTAAGNEWLYPPFSGLILYWLYLLGGYSALSWLLALAVVVTIAFLLCGRRVGIATCLAVILAVPSIVFRENARAELFTTLLFALYLAVLWQQFRAGGRQLWLLPVLMLFWVNLHPGFIGGLALLAGYVMLELCELPFHDRKAAALQRLRVSAPWVIASVLITVINPWGPWIYLNISRTSGTVKELGDFVGEWSRPNLSVSIFHQMLRWRDPESSFWWLIILTLAAVTFALWRRQIGAAILLASATFLALQYLRFQGLFACIAAIVGGAMLDDLRSVITDSESRPKPSLRLAVIAISAILLLTVAIRSADLITNRHYIEAGEVVLFGPGEASWFPERAAKFVLDNHLQPNLFNDYNLGGFLEWRLPEYKAYVDSRAIPFSVEFLTHQRALLGQPLDSAAWSTELEARNLNVIVLSVDRYTGLGKAPLDRDCASQNWRPVYLDETGVVFVRNTPGNAEVIRRWEIDCRKVPILFPENAQGSSYRARANAYNFYANAGAVCYLLGRDTEAQQYLARAAEIESHDSNLHLTQAQLFQADNQLQDAEREYKASIDQRPTDFAWYLLGVLYGRQHRYPEAVKALEQSAEISYNPADRYRVIGQVQNLMQQPREALATFDRAERIGSHGSIEDQRILGAQLASGRARSWQLLHDIDRAIAKQRESVALLPNDSGRWSTLAQLLYEKGDVTAAEKAKARAEALRVVH